MTSFRPTFSLRVLNSIRPFWSQFSRLRIMAWPVVAMVGASCAGCSEILHPPAPEPTPTPVPTPPRDLFDPADGVSKLEALPGKFRVDNVLTGELITVQQVTTATSGTPPREQKSYGASDRIRLAGIITPAPGKAGFADTVRKINTWVLGQEVDVEQDGRFPYDLNTVPMDQVFFTARAGQWASKEVVGQRLLLNRMLVRTGYAVVDLNSPTTIDVKPWLNDEEFARKKSLGLWGMGIVLGQRMEPPLPKNALVTTQRFPGKTPVIAPRRRRSGPSGTIAVTNARQTTKTKTTTTTTTTSTTPNASPPAPGTSAPPAASVSGTSPGASAPSGAANTASPAGASANSATR